MTFDLSPAARRLLLRCCIVNPEPSALAEAADFASGIDRWGALVAAAGKERLCGLLHVLLIRAGAADLPDPESAALLQRRYEQTAVSNLERIRELFLIRERSAAAGIAFALLKGMALLASPYDDIGLRAMGDMDLWVTPADRRRFSTILLSAGFHQDRLYTNTFRKNRTEIDLHTHPLGADRIRARKYLLRTEGSVMFHRARPARLMGKSFNCPAEFDQVVLLSIHALKHGLGRLAWMADVLNLTASWEDRRWNAFWRQCRDMGAERLVGRTFSAVAAFFPDEMGKWNAVAAKSSKRWAPTHLDQKLITRHVVGRVPLPFWGPSWLMRPQRNLFLVVLFFLETLFPKPAVLRQIFPRWSGLPSPILYGLRFVQILSRAVRGSARGKGVQPRKAGDLVR